MNTEERFRATGRNTGNQVIGYGLVQGLGATEISWNATLTPHEVSERFDRIVIAAANFLHPSFDFSGMAQFIETADLPAIMIGLGAQSRDYSPDIELQPGTDRLLRVVAERSELVGVRGAFTAQVLERKGIRNFQITGCPSFYMRGYRDFFISNPPLGEAPRLAMNLSRDVVRHSFDPAQTLSVINSCIEVAVRWGADFIAQTEAEEIAIAVNGAVQARGEVERLTKILADGVTVAELRQWIESRMRVYWSVPDWINDMANYDFVFGQRFHGNMAALLAGTPAVVLCHDTRTTEMCDFFGMSYLDIRNIKSISLDELYSVFDPHRLKDRYDVLLPRYIDFLSKNGLKAGFSRDAGLDGGMNR